jgi:hypothetical protein
MTSAHVALPPLPEQEGFLFSPYYLMSIDTEHRVESVESSMEVPQISALQAWIQSHRRGARALMDGKRAITFDVPNAVQQEIGRQNVVIDGTGIRHPANYELIYCDRQKLDAWLEELQM